jgi:hypothetical protein
MAKLTAPLALATICSSSVPIDFADGFVNI